MNSKSPRRGSESGDMSACNAWLHVHKMDEGGLLKFAIQTALATDLKHLHACCIAVGFAYSPAECTARQATPILHTYITMVNFSS